MSGAATIAKQYFETRRAFKLNGMELEAGDVVDLAEFDLPFLRATQLQNARLGTLVGDVSDISRIRDRVVPDPAPVAEATPEPESVQPILEDSPAVADVDSPSTTELGGWTTESLVSEFTIEGRRELCRKFGLTVRGNKSEVIARLLKFQEANDG